MAKDFNYVTIDSIFNQISRIPHYNINEDNIATDVSIALGFMFKGATQEDAVIFLKVENNIAEMPVGYSQIQRIYRYNKNYCIYEDEELLDILTQNKNESCLECEEEIGVLPSQESMTEKIRNKGYLSLRFPNFMFGNNYFRSNYSPVRPTNQLTFNALACDDVPTKGLVHGCLEYNIQKGLKKKILFSFESGYVAVAYKRPITDDNTDYPLIPDDSNANEAILYFVRSKIFEELAYAGREGYYNMASDQRERWGKYLKQFNNSAKMPQTEDDYQSDMESKLGAIPNSRRYYRGMNRVARPRRKF